MYISGDNRADLLVRVLDDGTSTEKANEFFELLDDATSCLYGEKPEGGVVEIDMDSAHDFLCALYIYPEIWHVSCALNRRRHDIAVVSDLFHNGMSVRFAPVKLADPILLGYMGPVRISDLVRETHAGVGEAYRHLREVFRKYGGVVLEDLYAKVREDQSRGNRLVGPEARQVMRQLNDRLASGDVPLPVRSDLVYSLIYGVGAI